MRSHGRARRAALALLVLVVFTFAALTLVRTDLVAGRYLRDHVRTASEGHGLHVEIGSVAPRGLTGIALRQVRVHLPGDDGPPLLHIHHVEVVPDLAQLRRGRLAPGVVTLDGVRASLDLDPTSSAARWLDERMDGASARPRSDVQQRSHRASTPQTARRSRMPERIVIRDAAVLARHAPIARDAELQLASTDALVVSPPRDAGRWSAEGVVELVGLGRTLVRGSASRIGDLELRLQALSDNDVLHELGAHVPALDRASLSVGGVRIQWPPQVTLRNVRVRDLALPIGEDWRMDAAWADEVTLALHEGRVRVHTSGWRTESRNYLWNTRIEAPSLAASYDLTTRAFDLRAVVSDGEGSLDLVLERDAARGLRLEALARRWDVATLAPLLPRSLALRPTAGRLDGRVEAHRPTPSAPWRLDVDGEAQGLAVVAPRIASEPLTWPSLALRAGLDVDPREGSLTLDEGDLRFGAARVHVTGTRRGPATGALALRLDPVAIDALLEALPDALMPTLAGFGVDGSIGFTLAVDLDPTRTDDPARIQGSMHLEGLAVRRWGSRARIDQLLDEQFAIRLPTYEGGGRMVGPGTSDWTPLASIGDVAVRAILAAEDDAFFVHGGFDWRGIQRAFAANVEAGRVVAGGSTISQQVVKNLFLNHDRTLARKLQEAALTVLLEATVPKERILEIYVNIAHWGPGLYGLRDASQGYFQRAPSELTLRESCFLAAILPNPALFGEQYARRVIAPSRRQKMQNILANLHRSGHIDAATLQHHVDQVQRGIISTSPPPEALLASNAHAAAHAAVLSDAPFLP